MHLSEIVDPDHLAEMIAGGYIKRNVHPDDAAVNIYCYTPKAQVEQVWTPATLNLRGLVTRDDEVIARPFGKFFVYEQHFNIYKKLPQGHAMVMEKVDGSIIIAYPFAEDEWRGASKSSFISPQAEWGTALIAPQSKLFDPAYTYVFELIHPENRIVVNYQNRHELVLLDVLNFDGSTNHAEFQRMSEHFTTPRLYDLGSTLDLAALSVLYQQVPEDEEGFVLRYDNGMRIKIKSEEYLRLHRIITNVTSRRVWEWIRDRLSLDQVLTEEIPDEIYTWIETTYLRMLDDIDAILADANQLYLRVKDLESRGAIARAIKDDPRKGYVFAMLDNKHDRAYDAAVKAVFPEISTRPQSNWSDEEDV